MSAVQPTAHEHHPLHILVSWPAVIAGAVVTIAVGAMLNLLGVALGAASIDPFEMTRGEAAGFSAGAGAWVAIANAIALFVGGFVASRAAKYSDHHKGYLHGLAVWALAFLIAIVLAGSSALGGVTSLVQGLDSNGVEEPNYVVDAVNPPLAGEGSEDALAVPPPVRRETDAAADSTATVALWAFLTMLLGAVAAIFGGRYGQRRHAWEAKARVTEEAVLPPAGGTTTTVHPGGATTTTTPNTPTI